MIFKLLLGMLQTFTEYVPVAIKYEQTMDDNKKNQSNLEVIQNTSFKRRLQFR